MSENDMVRYLSNTIVVASLQGSLRVKQFKVVQTGGRRFEGAHDERARICIEYQIDLSLVEEVVGTGQKTMS